MAHSCSQQNLLTYKFFLQLIPLVCIISSSFTVSDSAAPIQLHGNVGGNVTFHCPVDKKKPIQFFYLQRNDNFVNGHYTSKVIVETWKNTRVDVNQSAVHVYGLNVSHSGEYTCIVQYKELDHSILHHNINLSVTAPYSKPIVNRSCFEGQSYSCWVTCTSHGGYPQSKVTWDIPVPYNSSTQFWKITNSSEVPDQSTMMYSSSSTVNFNCTNGELKILCSVGEVTSDIISICKPVDVNEPYNVPVMIAICVMLSIAILGLVVFCARRRAAASAAIRVRDEPGESKAEEIIVLNEKRGE